MEKPISGYPGLTQKEASEILQKQGPNVLFRSAKRHPFRLAFEILTEPMVILLICASVLYFILGEWGEGGLLIVAILVVASISFFQTLKSDSALLELKKLTQARVQVKRDGVLILLPIEEIVPGDLVFLEEGMSIPADGVVMMGHDLAIDESSLTGESVSVNKVEMDPVFAGTELTSGSLYFLVKQTGGLTELGKLGLSMESIRKEKTVLQRQIDRFVTRMAWMGGLAFLLILGVNYQISREFIPSLLQGLTIAMAMIPEEIPVAFASFMALGAVRLASLHVLAREPGTVEGLGAATVICTDKTGTLTTGKMELVYLVSGNRIWEKKESPVPEAPFTEVLHFARLASEPEPFDPMEKAIEEAWQSVVDPLFEFRLVMEYPLTGRPPMMTHVYEAKDGQRFVAAKGGLERILSVCKMSEEQKQIALSLSSGFSSKGFRLLGVAKATLPESGFPENQDSFDWTYLGMVVLFNPPRENAHSVVQGFYKAGIQVKMMTGDYPETASAISAMVSIRNPDRVLTGAQVMEMDDVELKEKVEQVQVFARMFPEAKLRVVQALKDRGEGVVMTGDGVNDGPALKAAHIGVAMGDRGTEVARQAASLILVRDDLQGMLDAIALGRKIYQNLKKAISYIVSIHIPIILSVALPLVLGWEITGIFGPLHVIFLELVMGPTCSIAFENEPAEPGQMELPPRKATQTFFSTKELIQNIGQGLVLSMGVLLVYFWAMRSGRDVEGVRTMVFTTLVLGNIFLTLANRSFRYSVFRTITYRNPILWWMLGLTLFILVASLFAGPVQRQFEFCHLSPKEMLFCLGIALPSVFWVEIPKWFRPHRVGI